MGNKKPKSSKGKGSKSGGKKPPSNANGQDKDPMKDANLQVSPQEKVNAVKPLWETLSQEERVQLLTIPVSTLRERVKQLTDKAKEAAEPELIDAGAYIIEPALEEILEEGIKRLQQKETWKLWQWPPDNADFFDAEAFRQYMQERHIKADYLKLLPKEDGKPYEKPAEQALRTRMTDLLAKIQAANRQVQEDAFSRPTRSSRGQRVTAEQLTNAVRDTNIDIITTILEAMEQEHEFLYHFVLFPVTTYICEALPDDMRESNKTELYYEDLEKLPVDEVARIAEWLTEKVDALSTKLKPEPKDEEETEEEEAMGDVDLWSLAEEGTALTVNSKWLQHLQTRLLGEDGHPRKVQQGEDPHSMGLVLEWVYGSIVSTAEKARDGAKRSLSSRPPSAESAYHTLVRCFEDQLGWENRFKTCKEIMAEMLHSRKEMSELAQQYDLRPVPKNERGEMCLDESSLPDEVVLKMLRREVLLTRAKLHALLFEHIMGEKQLRSLKAQLRHNEPEFDRLKRELEEVKHAPRGLEGTYRTAAEMERHRHQLADAAIEEQLEVQTAFREHGARLQGIYDKRQRAEYEMAKRETEIKQLQGWKGTVENLIERFEELLIARSVLGDVEEGGAKAVASASAAMDADPFDSSISNNPARNKLIAAQHHMQLAKLRSYFHKDVRKQLYSEDDDKAFFNRIKTQVKQVEKRLEEGRVVLQHLEMHFINVACDDPGALIGAQLALPLLQEALDARALEYAAERAKAAEDEVLRMEEENQAREAAERERKQQQKKKRTDKFKNEKERAAAEKAAREEEARQQRERDEQQRREAEEAARLARLQQMEELRLQEEALMEQRKRELLSDENGYWRQRMALEEAARALASPQEESEEEQQQEQQQPAAAAAKQDSRQQQQPAAEDDDGFVTDHKRSRRAAAERMSRAHSSDSRSEPRGQHPMANGHAPRDSSSYQSQRHSHQRKPYDSLRRDTDRRDHYRQHNGPKEQQQQQQYPRSETGSMGSSHSSRADLRQEAARPSTPSTVTPELAVDSSTGRSTASSASSIGAAGRPAQQQRSVASILAAAAAAQRQAPQQQQVVPPQPPQQQVVQAAAQPATVQQQQESASSRAPAQDGVAQMAQELVDRFITFGTISDTDISSCSESEAEDESKPAAAAPAAAAVPAAAPITPAAAQPQHPQHPPQQPHPPRQQQQQPARQPSGPQVPPTPAHMHAAAMHQMAQQMFIPQSMMPMAMQHMAGQPGKPSQLPVPMVAMPAGAMPGMPMMIPAAVQQQMYRRVPPAVQLPHGQPPPPPPAASPNQPPPSPAAAAAAAAAPPGPQQPPPPPPPVVPLVPASPQHQQPAAALPASSPVQAQRPPVMPIVPQPSAAMQPAFAGHGQYAAGMAPGMMPPGAAPVGQVPPAFYMYNPAAAAAAAGMVPPGLQQAQYMAMVQQGMAGLQVPPHMAGNPAAVAAAIAAAAAAAQAPQQQQQHPAVVSSQQQQQQQQPQMPQPQQAVQAAGSKLSLKGSTLRAGAQPFIPSTMRATVTLPAKPALPAAGPAAAAPAAAAPEAAAPSQPEQQQQQQQQQEQQPAADKSAEASAAATATISMVADARTADTAPQQQEEGQPAACTEAAPATAASTEQRQQQQQQAPPPPSSQPTQPPASPAAVPPAAVQPAAAAAATPAPAPAATPAPAAPAATPVPAAPAATPVPAAPAATPAAATPAATQAPAAPAAATPAATPAPAAPAAATTPAATQAPAAPAAATQAATPAPAAPAAPAPPQQPKWSAVAARDAHPAPLSIPAPSSSPAAAAAAAAPLHSPSQPAPAAAPVMQGSWRAGADSLKIKLQQGGQQQQQQQQLGSSPPARHPAGSWQQPRPASRQAAAAPGAPTADSSSRTRPGRPTSASRQQQQQQQEQAQPPAGKLLMQPSGQVIFAPNSSSSQQEQQQKVLKLVRMLDNTEGVNNCFLNVIIQSLWHLKGFREALLALAPQQLPASSPAADIRVTQALWNIFSGLAAAPAAAAAAADAPPRLSPTELREALSSLDNGQVSVKMDLTDMHDASEVLGDILNSISRAQLGKLREGADDPQLPKRVRVRAPAAEAAAPAAGSLASVLMNGVANGTAAAPAAPAAAAPCSLVHTLFGLDVQTPCPPDDDEDEEDSSKKSRKRPQQQQQGQQQGQQQASSQSPAASGAPAAAAAASPRPRKPRLEPGMLEVQQYMKYFHLVPAQGLRLAHDTLFDCTFEEVLREADAADTLASRLQGGSAQGPQPITLLRKPHVFTLAVVWESPQAPADAIRGTVRALRPSVELSRLFAGVAPGPVYNLRCVVCYFGHHYQAFALSEELRQWLLFDDKHIEIIGGWGEVCAAMVSNRMQPSVLFYESSDA